MTLPLASPADADLLIESIAALVDINSGSANIDGIAQVQTQLQSTLAPIGDATIGDPITIDSVGADGQPSTTTCGPMLELAVRPDLERRLLIVGHADTVFGPASPFQQAEQIGSRLHGPGTADMKGGLVVAFEALRQLEAGAAIDNLGIDILVTGDEETGALASAPRIAELASKATAGIALEPPMADGSFARARAGSANITIVVSGRSAHAGRALADGRNAVIAAARLALVASALDANVASINGGDAFNAVPDACVMRINKRGAEPADIDAVIDGLRETADTLSQELEVSFTFFGHQHRPAKPWNDGHQRLANLVSAAAAAAGREASFIDTFGVCDGNNMAATGLAVVDTMGIRGANIHTPQEFAEVGDLAEQVAFVADVIARIAKDWTR